MSRRRCRGWIGRLGWRWLRSDVGLSSGWQANCYEDLQHPYAGQEFPTEVAMQARKQANDNGPMGLEVAVIELSWASGHWLVEAVDHGSEGEVYRATFDGSMAKQRAYDYARLTYGFPSAVTQTSTST